MERIKWIVLLYTDKKKKSHEKILFDVFKFKTWQDGKWLRGFTWGGEDWWQEEQERTGETNQGVEREGRRGGPVRENVSCGEALFFFFLVFVAWQSACFCSCNEKIKVMRFNTSWFAVLPGTEQSRNNMALVICFTTPLCWNETQ